MSREQLKQQLVEHYHWLRQYGCNDSHSGTASFRWHDEIWITPTGSCADTLKPEDLIYCHIEGDLDRGASLDAALHIQVYQQNPTTKSVIHSHGAHTIAITLNGDNFVPIDFAGQCHFPLVPLINIPYEHSAEQGSEAVANALKDHKLVVVKGHGVYSGAESINLAYKWICSLELSAKIACLAKQIQ